MGKYVRKRLILAFFTGLIILTVVFILAKSLPVDKPIGTDAQKASFWETEIARGYIIKSNISIVGMRAIDTVKTNEGSVYYYQVPVMQQYFRWVQNILTKWDWGVSQKIDINTSVGTIIRTKLPYSIKINLWATLISVPLGILVGIWAALKKNKPTDSIISTIIIIFISVPSFVLITFLLQIFCYSGTQILPPKWPDKTAALDEKIRGYIIPVISLSVGSIAGYGRFTRAELCDVMSSEYLLLARTKGLTRGQAIRRHALRNAMVPILPSIVAEVIGIFVGGAMITETLYTIPGIGSLFVDAINTKDWNVLFVVMAIQVVVGLLSGIIVDLSYGFIDPRIRMGAKK